MQRFSKNFSDRLAHYGLAQVAHEHINITSPITIDDNNSPFAIKEITTNCLDELKSLIGTPNNQANAAPSSEHLALSSLATIPDDKIYDAATAYIFAIAPPCNITRQPSRANWARVLSKWRLLAL